MATRSRPRRPSHASPAHGEDEARRRHAQVEQLEDVGLVLEEQLLADHGEVEHAALAARQQVGARSAHPRGAVGLEDAGLVLQPSQGGDRKAGRGEQPEHGLELRVRLEADAQGHPALSARRTSRHEPSALFSPGSSST